MRHNRIETIAIIALLVGIVGVTLGLPPITVQAHTLTSIHAARGDGINTVYLPQITSVDASPQCTPKELLQDGSFEAGLPNPVWQSESNVFSDILDDLPFPPAHHGNWKAWLGGDNQVQESLWQTFNVPTDGNTLAISYWWRVDTFESTHPFDTLKVQIRDASGNPLETLETLTDGHADTSWQQSTFYVKNYAGRTIQLAFLAQTDETNPTSFFIDHVSVIRACP